MAAMTNGEAFRYDFGIYATELWAMPEDNFLEWLNAPCDRPKNMPSVQPEIVRCKNCTYFIEDKLFGDCWCYTYGANRVKPDDFCSKGVRRADA